MTEMARRPHARAVVEWGRAHPDAVVLSGDLTTSCEVDNFRDAFPERFLSMGLAEQNMMSFAAGLAREGLSPLVHTFAVFMYRRALDQIEMSIAYPNLPVRIFGFLPGVTTPGGASHQAINDLSVLRSLPNMTIVETGDATDVEGVLPAIAAVDGPVYVRMLRGEVSRLFPASRPLRLGRARLLGEGNDIALFTTGICTEEALRAVVLLRERGVGIQHLHVSTLKPFTDPLVLDTLRRCRRAAIAMENHTVLGGLGTCVAEFMAERGVGVPLVRIGLDDTYLQGASAKYLVERYEIGAAKLIRTVEAIMGGSFGISSEDVARAPVDAFHSENQQEAL
ncbi:MAG: transketolase [Gluconacetobacter diazotrophicus]|nr:transketolase [Gluconacetobacter diazotrophicus]